MTDYMKRRQKQVHVVIYNSCFPGQVAPDIDEWMSEDEALERYGEPESKVGVEWQYF